MSEGAVEFRTLGPIELSVDGGAVAVRGGKLQTLLALLLIKANSVAERDWLIDQLWSGQPPATAIPTLRSHVYQLRKHLTRCDGAALAGKTGGYSLQIAASSVDSHQFEAAASQGRQALQRGELEEAASMFRAGLALWRGDAFAGIDAPAVRDRARLLDELRLEITELRLSAELDRGTPTMAVAELESLTAAFPMREELWRLLMISLYRTGRQGEALQAYQRLYRLLDDELGVSPSGALEQLHRQILTGDPQLHNTAAGTVTVQEREAPPSLVPRQLPAAAVHFTGRGPQLAALSELLRRNETGAESEAAAAVITGTAGVGKTALAIHWGHRVAEHFPDGQLYVNLRGFDPAGLPITPADALRTLLEALGVPSAQIPAGLDARSGLYRSLLADRRILVVLDNARDADQARPLLPGARGSVAVVTSRHHLVGLLASGAHSTFLAPLDADDAGSFLACRLHKDRTAAEPEAVHQIIDACAGLPLALAIVAARAATHPDFELTALAAELLDTNRRLDVLAEPGDVTDLRAVFSWSFQALSADAARLFRLLSVHPGPELSRAAATGIAAVASQRAHRLLSELARANLLIEMRPGRFAFHDLLRAYAAELADDTIPSAELTAVFERLLDGYLGTAYEAAIHLDRSRPPVSDPPTATEAIDSPSTATAWLTQEYAVLYRAMEHAMRHGLHSRAWKMAFTLQTFQQRTGRVADWVTSQRIAVRAATADGDPAASAAAHRRLAGALFAANLRVEAREHAETALALFDQFGDLDAQAGINILLSWSETPPSGDGGRSADFAERAIALYRMTGNLKGQASGLNNLAWYFHDLGDDRTALRHCNRALELLREDVDPVFESHALDTLAQIHLGRGDLADAASAYERSAALVRGLGDLTRLPRQLDQLADLYDRLGQFEGARTARNEAVGILQNSILSGKQQELHRKLTDGLKMTPDRPPR